MSLSNIKVNNSNVLTVDNTIQNNSDLVQNKAIYDEFLKFQLGSISEQPESVKRYIPSLETSSGYYNDDGLVPGSFSHSEFIYISDILNSTLTYYGRVYHWTIAGFDSNKEFVEILDTYPWWTQPDETVNLCTITVPSGIEYISINILEDDNSWYIEYFKYIRQPFNVPGISITTSQISDYTPGGQTTGTYSLKYKISKALYALGDSVTYGIGDSSNSGGWAQRLSNKISFSNFYKYAVSGATSMHLERSWLSSQIAKIPNNSTDIIVVMIGTNDCNINYTVGDVDSALVKSYDSLDPTNNFSESFRSDMESLKRKCPLATIIYVLPVSNSTVAEPRMENFLEVMRKVCAALSIPVLETRDEAGIPQRLNLGMASTWMSDGLHPGPNGHELVATYVAGYLMRYADQVILS